MTDPRHVHAVIRQGGAFLMRYSSRYCYYQFPHDTAGAEESPEQALCRIVPAQTGLTVEPGSIRLCCRVISHPDEGSRQEHLYFRCRSNEGTAAAHPAPDDRFTLQAVSRSTALEMNTKADHGILTDDTRFQAMLDRENLALRTYRLLTPVQLCGIALAVSLLFPFLAGLYLMLFGFDSPTDGGTVTGLNAFYIGVLFGIVPAVPAAIVSLILLLESRKQNASGKDR